MKTGVDCTLALLDQRVWTESTDVAVSIFIRSDVQPFRYVS
jgi:hypothetical protein